MGSFSVLGGSDMKKKTAANLVMAAIIVVIAAAGILCAGHILGWFDQDDGTSAVLCDIRGVIRLERDGVSTQVSGDTVLRNGDQLTATAGATAKIRLDGGWLTIGEKAELTVIASNADGFSGVLSCGELFANCQSPAVITFDGHQAEIRDAAAHISVRTGTQIISVFSGTVGEAGTGQMAEYIGDTVTVHTLHPESLNDFTIGQIRMANEGRELCFTNAMLDKLAADRNQSMQDLIDSQLPTIQPTDPTADDHIHSYTVSLIPPTCTQDGYTEHICDCGDRYTDAPTAATGHAWSEWITVKEPTSGTEGLRQRRCGNCDAVEEESIDKLPEGHVHSYSEKTVAATCTTEGYVLHTCSCGVSYKDQITAALGHHYTEEVIAPTCTEAGYTRHTCACGAAYTDGITPALGHHWSEWVTVRESTAQEEGLQRRTCDRCGTTEEKSIPKLQPVIAGYVTITIRCDTILDNMDELNPAKAEFVPADGVILPALRVYFYEGETAFDVLVRVCEIYDIQLEYSWSVYGSYYIEGIHNLYEFDCGSESGWMYKVDGWFPNYGCSAYTLTDGQTIEWLYTCHGYGTDIGAPSWEG